jgi:hypothetical protein
MDNHPREKSKQMASKNAEKGVVMSAPVSPRKRVVRKRAMAPLETVSHAAGPQAKTAAPAIAPSRNDIAQLAYSYWQARGCQGGSPEEDWARAERELQQIASAAVA